MPERQTHTDARRVRFLREAPTPGETYATVLEDTQRDGAEDGVPGDSFPPGSGDEGYAALTCLALQLEEIRHIVKCMLQSMEEDKQRMDRVEAVLKTSADHIDRLEARTARLELQHGTPRAGHDAVKARIRIPIPRP